jgi:hypothetical protein
MISIVQVAFLYMYDFVLTEDKKKNVSSNSINISFLHHHKMLFQIVNLVYDIVLKYNFVLQQPLNKKIDKKN